MRNGSSLLLRASLYSSCKPALLQVCVIRYRSGRETAERAEWRLAENVNTHVRALYNQFALFRLYCTDFIFNTCTMYRVRPYLSAGVGVRLCVGEPL